MIPVFAAIGIAFCVITLGVLIIGLTHTACAAWQDRAKRRQITTEVEQFLRAEAER